MSSQNVMSKQTVRESSRDNAVADRSSTIALAIEDARFTEAQIRDAVKSQLAQVEARANEVHAERFRSMSNWRSP